MFSPSHQVFPFFQHGCFHLNLAVIDWCVQISVHEASSSAGNRVTTARKVPSNQYNSKNWKYAHSELIWWAYSCCVYSRRRSVLVLTYNPLTFLVMTKPFSVTQWFSPPVQLWFSLRKWIWETITSNARLIFPIFVVLMPIGRWDRYVVATILDGHQTWVTKRRWTNLSCIAVLSRFTGSIQAEIGLQRDVGAFGWYLIIFEVGPNRWTRVDITWMRISLVHGYLVLKIVGEPYLTRYI